MTALRLRDRRVDLEPGRPLVMGIVNAGSDSFSDAVRLTSLDRQVAHALALAADGADLIDVGAESGVTYTPQSRPEREAALVVPLVERLVAEGLTVSVDTYKPPVAEAALAAGAAMINDVSGLRDPALADLAAASGAALVLMHTRAEPKRERFPDYGGDGEVFVTAPGAEIEEGHELVAAIDAAHAEVWGEAPARDVTRWFSDASALTRYGVPTVNYGTSTGLMDVELGENLEIDALVKTAEVYARVAMEVCGTA